MARPEDERAAFLQEACAGDPALRREVESLLRYAGHAQGFMSRPAIEVVGQAFGDGRAALVGRRLGPYEVEAHLGSGGMGDVYRARDPRLGRSVAIKILPSGFSADPDRRARFEREARVLAALSHPHIGAIFGFEEWDGVHGLILELVEGRTLEQLLGDGPIQLPLALTLARQVADALAAAHDKGIIHRDLKPANIAVTDAGVVKVFDFGLAKAGDDSLSPASAPLVTVAGTHQGTILGTAAYMSPEQARGQRVDRRTDIWAFGCVLLEMLTGRQAFAAETVSDTIVALLHRTPAWDALPAHTPAAIRRLLQRCLEKDAARRLHHMADARLELEDALSEPRAESADASVSTISNAPGQARWVAAIAVGVALVAAAAGVRNWRTAPPSTPGRLARLSIPLPATHVFENGRFPRVALSPDGTLLVYAAAVRGGRTSLFLRPFDDLSARPLAATEGATTPFFSPDGRWIAFYVDGQLKKVPVTGGLPLTICEAPPVWSAAWGDNDRIVFATTLAASGLWAVAASGGEAVPLTHQESDEEQHGYPQFLPGGQVLFSIRRERTWSLARTTPGQPGWQALGNKRGVGEAAQYLATGHVLSEQAGGLVVTPFNPETGDLGQPVPLLERVETSRFGGPSFAVAAQAGTLVYLPAGGAIQERSLLRVERDGRAAPLLTARAAYESPSLSPDGRRVAVTIAAENGSDVWIIDLERAARIRFTAGGTSAFSVWGPGGRIAFQSTTPGPWNLFWKPIDESSTPQPLLNASLPTRAAATWPNPGAGLLPGTLPTLSGAGPQYPGSWVRDGSALAFHERKPNGERDIWTVAPGSDAQPYLLTPFDEHSPRFSPDGKWLAYVSDEGGRDEVYVQPFPGPGPKWLISTEGGTDPLWSRDGRELFYRAGDELFAVRVAATSAFSAERPRRLFEIRFDSEEEGANYDVSPDGTWFVMARSEERPGSDALHVVLNWFTEVRARTTSSSADRSKLARD